MTFTVDLFWNDLTPEKQKELIRKSDGYVPANYKDTPIATIEYSSDKEIYKKHGRAIIEIIVKSQKSSYDGSSLTPNEVQEVMAYIDKLNVDYGILFTSEFGCGIYNNLKEIALESLQSNLSYSDGSITDGVLLKKDCINLEKVGQLLYQDQKDEYIHLSTDKYVWFAFDEMWDGVNEDILSDYLESIKKGQKDDN